MTESDQRAEAFALGMNGYGEADAGMTRRAVRKLRRLGPPSLVTTALIWHAELLIEGPRKGALGDEMVQLDEADKALRDAARLAPTRAEPPLLQAELATMRNDVEALAAAVTRLREVAPHDPRTHAHASVVALARGDRAAARASLARARALGFDDHRAKLIEDQIGHDLPIGAVALGALVVTTAIGAAVALRMRRKRQTIRGS